MLSWFNSVWQAACFEARGMPKRTWEWITSIVLPLMWLCIVANTFGEGLMHKLPVGLVNADGDSVGRETVMIIDSLPSVQLIAFDSLREAEASLRQAKTYATVYIPRHYTRDTLSGEGGSVELMINKSYYAIATILELDIKTALAYRKKDRGAEQMTALRGGTFAANDERLRIQFPDVTFLGNPAFNFTPYLLATLIPGLLVIAGSLAFVGTLVRDWRDGSVTEWLAAAGGRPVAAIAGKLLPWVGIYMLFITGWVAAFTGWYGCPVQGSLTLWILGSLMLVAAIAAVSVFITALSLTWVLAVTGVIAMFAPSFPFTGFSYPFESMTPGAAFFGQLLPLTHYLELQGQCWILNSPLDHSARTLGVLALFILIPLSAGLPILAHRVRGWARIETKTRALWRAAHTPDKEASHDGQ